MAEEFTNVEARLVSRIKELGLKQSDICQETGLSTTAVSNYCTGKRLPDTLSLYKMAMVLKVPMEWILTGKNPTNEESEQERLQNLKLLKHKEILSCDGSPLEDEEADIIAMYRLLPDPKQEDVFDIVLSMYKRHIEKKKESIYSTYTRGSSKLAGGLAEGDENQGGIA